MREEAHSPVEAVCRRRAAGALDGDVVILVEVDALLHALKDEGLVLRRWRRDVGRLCQGTQHREWQISLAILYTQSYAIRHCLEINNIA